MAPVSGRRATRLPGAKSSAPRTPPRGRATCKGTRLLPAGTTARFPCKCARTPSAVQNRPVAGWQHSGSAAVRTPSFAEAWHPTPTKARPVAKSSAPEPAQVPGPPAVFVRKTADRDGDAPSLPAPPAPPSAPRRSQFAHASAPASATQTQYSGRQSSAEKGHSAGTRCSRADIRAADQRHFCRKSQSGPAVGWSNPAIKRGNVVSPQPESPSRLKNPFARMFRLMPSSACWADTPLP